MHAPPHRRAIVRGLRCAVQGLPLDHDGDDAGDDDDDDDDDADNE